MMIRSFVLVAFMVMMLMARQASGQSPCPGIYAPCYAMPPTSADTPAYPLEDVADVIVVLVPDSAYALDRPASFERTLQGSIVRIEKGVVPAMIVHTASTFTNPLRAGVPVRLFLSKFKDRDAYYIIGVDLTAAREKP